MKLLLHVCCAVCLAAPIRKLKEDGINVSGYFYNPNIHPFLEFRRRIKALKVLQESEPFQIVYEEEYGLTEYLGKVDYKGGNRCNNCYELRLEKSAQYAKDHNFDAFSSTLLFSKHQDHDKIKSLGYELENKHKITFGYFDYRHLFEDCQKIIKKRMIYKQSYCGCIFSEHERYKNTGRHLYKKEIVKPSVHDCHNKHSGLN
ncbi:MAG: epoxyqueuosine reductase QueH [Candidatus Anammoxibacter sp.]